MDRLAPGTAVKTYEGEEFGWLVGKITSWDETAKIYKVEYDNAKIKTKKFREQNILEPVLMACLVKKSKISIYSYSDSDFYDAEIKEVDDSKLDNLKAVFDSGMNEWIDIRRYKYHIVSIPKGRIPKTTIETNIAMITANTTAAASTLDSKKHPFPNVRNVSGPAPSSIAFVDKGTVIAMRWKRPYILYDATVVKMKDDGSQYLLQYHYDSCTKWVDLRKTEFYVIGVDATFADAVDDGPAARATRRARKSEGAAVSAEDSNPRKRRRALAPPEPTEAAAAVEAEDEEKDNKPANNEKVRTVDDNDVDDIQKYLLKQIHVCSRIAVLAPNHTWRKATVLSFEKNHKDFEIQYDDSDKHTRINLKQNVFMMLQAPAGSKHDAALPKELASHVNPDTSLIDVGTKVRVFWKGDSKFYPATIMNKRKGAKPFYLEYEDGDVEWIDLSERLFKLDADF
eukprot:scaffold10377_cov150-Amphora_coffeaeformis.AAC.4